jgi:hypothetical protein
MRPKPRREFFYSDNFDDFDDCDPQWEYHSVDYNPVTTYLADENEEEELEELLDFLVYGVHIS